jgi:uncharacterized protein
MRIVLDTNTFVAAGYNPDSHSATIIGAVERGSLSLVWHRETKSETRKVIEHIPRLSWEHFRDLFTEENEFRGAIQVDNYPFIEDPEDRKFAALADVTGTTIVTSDQHLLSQKDRIRAQVMTPRQFLEQAGQS